MQSVYYSASSLYMFWVSTTPIIRSTQNCNYSLRYCTATSLQRSQVGIWPRWREVGVPILWPIPEAVVTVFSTSDDRCGGHPKHVQWTCRIINRLRTVAFSWIFINIELWCTEPWASNWSMMLVIVHITVFLSVWCRAGVQMGPADVSGTYNLHLLGRN